MKRNYIIGLLLALFLLPVRLSAHFYVPKAELTEVDNVGISLEELFQNAEEVEGVGLVSEEVYLYNVGRDLFLNAGDYYGVRTVLYDVGIPVRIVKTEYTDVDGTGHVVYKIHGPFKTKDLFVSGNGDAREESWLRGNNSVVHPDVVIDYSKWGTFGETERNEEQKVYDDFVNENPDKAKLYRKHHEDAIRGRRVYFGTVPGGTNAVGENWSFEEVIAATGLTPSYVIRLKAAFNPGTESYSPERYNDFMLVGGQPTALPIFLKNNPVYKQSRYRNIVTLKTEEEEAADASVGGVLNNNWSIGEGKLENRYWKIVTKDQLRKDYDRTYERERASNASFLVQASNFNRANVYNFEENPELPGWHKQGTFDYACDFKSAIKDYTDDVRFCQFDCAGITCFNFNKTDEEAAVTDRGKKGDMLYQDVEMRKSGWYRIDCQGMYYNNSSEPDGQSNDHNNDRCLAELFATVDGVDDANGASNVKVDLVPRTFGDAQFAKIESVIDDAKILGEADRTDGIVSNKLEAGIAFSMRYYPNSVLFYLDLNGQESRKVRVGIRLKEDLTDGDYVFFDDFQLKYVGEPFVLDENDVDFHNTGLEDDNIDYVNRTLILKRSMVLDKWNPITLPVDLNKRQLTTAFGQNVKLAQLSSLTGRTVHFATIDLVSKAMEDVVLEKDHCYIINPELDGKAGTYVVNGAQEQRVEVEGPYYPISRVSLKKSDVTNAGRVTDPCGPFANADGCEIQMFGSYQKASVPANAYAFSNGKLYHITTDMETKGFRCWIEDRHQMGTENAARRHQLGTYVGGVADETTSIDWVYGECDDAMAGNGIIYNLNGQTVGAGKTAVSALPKGIYVVNGKKIVVK